MTTTFFSGALKLERALSDLVNQAYGMTPEEIALTWQTAPPPMLIPSARAMITVPPILTVFRRRPLAAGQNSDST
jgi:hypothetical protein